ncbi:MAG: MFS transporter [Anaerolineae bacterium]|nr:MFS transporter [Anaerolineae bacterium]
MTTPAKPDQPEYTAWTLLTRSPIRFHLLLFLIARTVMNSGFRMVYPLLPVFARGVGVDPSQVQLAISARSAVGLLSPLIGPAADQWGRKRAMLAGVGLFVATMAMVFIWPTYPALFIALVMTLVSKMLFDPATYAYLGDKVDYRQRGLVVGISEFGWSGAFLIGIPILGWLIERGGWTTPFLALALVGVGIGILVWRTLPPDHPSERSQTSLLSGARQVLTDPVTLAGIGIGFCISGSNEVVNIIFGVWMDDVFAVQLATLAIASVIIGAAELGGEGLIAGFADRVGKRRIVGIGLVLYAVSSFLLPVLGTSLEGALVGFFLFYLGFEFSLVATLPLLTELAPNARATLMSINATGHLLGRLIGSLVGPALIVSGLGANAALAGILNLIGLALLMFFVHEKTVDSR